MTGRKLTHKQLLADCDMSREMSCGYGRKTTWTKLLAAEMESNGDAIEDGCLLARRIGPTPAHLPVGGPTPVRWWAWTANYVYSSWEEERAEVISLPRNPSA